MAATADGSTQQQDVQMRRIIDNLSTDLNNLSSETKRKFASVKEASEACLLKLRVINNLKSNLYKSGWCITHKHTHTPPIHSFVCLHCSMF